ncbi:hypothetical protein [Niallia circulans]|jgi:hypothetical protein|uniref:hypothetical protein n=2 Tax=Niallia TaxID=2837506 RepID=UPI0035240153
MKNKSIKFLLVTISIVFLCFSLLPSSISANENQIRNNTVPVSNQLKITFGTIDKETSSLILGEQITPLSLNGYLDDLILSSDDINASYELVSLEPSELQEIKNLNPKFKPTNGLLLNYTDLEGNIQQVKYYLSTQLIEAPINSDVSLFAVDTIFDIASFTLSLKEYKKNKTFWNGFWVVADGAAVVFPGIPAVSGVKRMIEGSTTVLKPALSKGIRKYSTLQNISAPKNYKGKGWERHHIFEKRFASKLGTSSGKMLAIFIPKYNYHYQITQRMSKKIPWYTAPRKTKKQIIQAHIDAYGELWAESGFADEYWEFLYKFSKYKQYD